MTEYVLASSPLFGYLELSAQVPLTSQAVATCMSFPTFCALMSFVHLVCLVFCAVCFLFFFHGFRLEACLVL